MRWEIILGATSAGGLIDEHVERPVSCHQRDSANSRRPWSGPLLFLDEHDLQVFPTNTAWQMNLNGGSVGWDDRFSIKPVHGESLISSAF